MRKRHPRPALSYIISYGGNSSVLTASIDFRFLHSTHDVDVGYTKDESSCVVFVKVNQSVCGSSMWGECQMTLEYSSLFSAMHLKSPF